MIKGSSRLAKDTNTVLLVIYAWIALLFVLALLNAPKEAYIISSEIFGAIVVALMASLVAGVLISGLTGDILEKVFLKVDIGGVEISFSVFFIVATTLGLILVH